MRHRDPVRARSGFGVSGCLRRTCRASAGRTSPPRNGLPDNHVYSVCVDGDRVWAGTDNGLALYEKGKWKVFTAGGRPGASRGALRDRSTSAPHDVWARHHGRLSRYLGRPLRHLHAAEQRAGQRRGLRRRRAGRLRVGGDRRRRQPPEYAHRPVEPVQRAQHADVRDLDLRRQPRPRTRSTTRSGAAACSSTTSRPTAGRTTTTRTARPKSCFSRTRA